MSEHPLSSVTKFHIANCLRATTNEQPGRFMTDRLHVKINLYLDNKDGIRNGFLRLVAQEPATNTIHNITYCFKERHVKESILKEGEFKLTPDAIKLVANKWFYEFQEVARRANNDKTILH